MTVTGILDPTAAICIADDQTNILFTSAGHASILGRTTRDVVGARWRDWTSAGTLTDALARNQAFWIDKNPYDILTCVIRSDGVAVPVLVRCSAINGRDGDLLFAEMREVDGDDIRRSANAMHTANYVRELTYDLARQSGRYRLRNLTNSLLAASASAEKAVEMLANAASDLPR